jgi:hypothetical protein
MNLSQRRIVTGGNGFDPTQFARRCSVSLFFFKNKVILSHSVPIVKSHFGMFTKSVIFVA